MFCSHSVSEMQPFNPLSVTRWLVDPRPCIRCGKPLAMAVRPADQCECRLDLLTEFCQVKLLRRCVAQSGAEVWVLWWNGRFLQVHRCDSIEVLRTFQSATPCLPSRPHALSPKRCSPWCFCESCTNSEAPLWCNAWGWRHHGGGLRLNRLRMIFLL